MKTLFAMPQPHIPMRHVPQDGPRLDVRRRQSPKGLWNREASDRRRIYYEHRVLNSLRRAPWQTPFRGLRKSMPDTLLFLNARTNSSRWLPNSCFNSAIEIHSVGKDVSILGQRTASRRSRSSLPAPVAVFLASEASFWITGEIILASGGMR